MKRVHVSNIPLRAFIAGWIEVPDNTTDETMQAALVTAILERGFKEQGDPYDPELDDDVVESGWEFSIVEVRT